MIRKLGFLVTVMSLALPAWSAPDPGTISGYVRSATGVPQMGAVVEVLGAAMLSPRVFTDDRGFYSIKGLAPGSYTVKVSAPSFLPALREKLGLRPGAKLMVNVTLTTLFEAIQLGPLRGPGDDEDWKWTLRSVANRPVLRVLPDGTHAVVQTGDSGGDRDLKGKLVFMAGSSSEGFGGPSDVSTGFSVEHSFMSSGTLSVHGNLGYGGGVPTAVIRTSYSNRFNNGFEPTLAFTVRRLNSPDVNNLHGAGLQALSLTSSDRMLPCEFTAPKRLLSAWARRYTVGNRPSGPSTAGTSSPDSRTTAAGTSTRCSVNSASTTASAATRFRCRPTAWR